MADVNTDIKNIAEHYGYYRQSRQLIEEMAELMVAINKHERYGFRPVSTVSDALQVEHLRDNIIEEIADVEIMLAQIKHLMDCEIKVDIQKHYKVKRQIERIEKESAKNEHL